MLLGLTFYTGAFIAEIVRGEIQSVAKGQWETARSLGLKPGLVMRLVIFPQALRVIIPPLTSQYLNLTKKTSLAIAIGYPDIYFVDWRTWIVLAIASTLGAITEGVFFSKQQLTKWGIVLFAFIIGVLLVVLPLDFTSRLWLLIFASHNFAPSLSKKSIWMLTPFP